MVEANQTVHLPNDRFTHRQLVVVRMYAAGLTQSAIASELGISIPGVETHVELARRRFKTPTIATTVIAAFESEQLDPDSFVNDDDIGKIELLSDQELEVFKSLYKNREIRYRKPLVRREVTRVYSINRPEMANGTVGKLITSMNTKLEIATQTRAIVLGYYAEQRGMSF